MFCNGNRPPVYAYFAIDLLYLNSYRTVSKGSLYIKSIYVQSVRCEKYHDGSLANIGY